MARIRMAAWAAVFMALLVACGGAQTAPESGEAAAPVQTDATPESDGEAVPTQTEAEETGDTPESGGEAELVRAEAGKTYDIDVQMVPIPDDAAAVARGEHIARGWAFCTSCHIGGDFSGGGYISYKQVFRVPRANLTPGEGGIGATYGDEDWVRAVRHGVRPDGTSILFHPSYRYANLSDEDLGALVAYLKSLPPADNVVGVYNILPQATLADLEADVALLPARFIDHEAEHPVSVEPAPSAAYGEYLVNTSVCRQCHGEELNGATMQNTGTPTAPNLTQGSESAGWSEATFVGTLRSGIRPDGESLHARLMPPEIFEEMSDMEMAALYAYLQTLPAVESGY